MKNLFKRAISVVLIFAFVISAPIKIYAAVIPMHEEILKSIGVNPEYVTDIETIGGLTKYTVFNPTFNEEVSYIIDENEIGRTIYIEQGNKTDVVVHYSNGDITVNANEINITHTIDISENVAPYSLQNNWVTLVRQSPLVGSPSNYGNYPSSPDDGGSILMEAALATMTMASVSYIIFTWMPQLMAVDIRIAKGALPTFVGMFCDTLAANLTTVAVANAPQATSVTYERYRVKDNILSDVFNRYYKCKLKYYIAGIYVPNSDFEYYLSEQYV